MTDLATAEHRPGDTRTHEQAVPDPSAPPTERVRAVLPRRRPRSRPAPAHVSAGAVGRAVLGLASLALGAGAAFGLATRSEPERRLVADPPVTATTPDRRTPALPTPSLTKGPGVSLCLRHCDPPPTAVAGAQDAPATTAAPQATAPTTATTAPGTDPATDGPAQMPVDQSPTTTGPGVVVTLPPLPPLEPFDPGEDEAPPVTEAPEPETTTTEGTTPPVTDPPTSEEDTDD